MIFPYPTVSYVFQGLGFSGSRFFRVQVFRVWVQVIEVATLEYLIEMKYTIQNYFKRI